jgi:hypothetical protein
MLLQSTLENGSYNKLHSYKHIINGFSVHTTPSQVLTPLHSSSPYPFQSFLHIYVHALKLLNPLPKISGKKTKSYTRSEVSRKR